MFLNPIPRPKGRARLRAFGLSLLRDIAGPDWKVRRRSSMRATTKSSCRRLRRLWWRRRAVRRLGRDPLIGVFFQLAAALLPPPLCLFALRPCEGGTEELPDPLAGPPSFASSSAMRVLSSSICRRLTGTEKDTLIVAQRGLSSYERRPRTRAEIVTERV